MTIKLLSGGMAGLIKDFEAADRVILGRAAEADVRLHPTEDKTVGRRHAMLYCTDGQWHIESLHENGVWLHGESLTSPVAVRNGDIYMLGSSGPEFRVSLLGDEVSATIRDLDLDGGLGGTWRPASQRRVEFDPAEVETSIRQESRRTLRFIVPMVLLLIGGAGLGLIWLLPRADPLLMSGAEIQRTYRGSVFRAVGTVRFRSDAPDVRQSAWTRYWTLHGTSFAIGKKDGWVYAVTNHHVFGDPSRADLSTDQGRNLLAIRGVLERWPRDWPELAEKLAAFEARRSAVDVTNATARSRIGLERYEYLEAIADQCEFDLNDDAWRQVIVDGEFLPVEVVESASDMDLVLFRFREPARPIEPLPLRRLTRDDESSLSGRPVHILGFPAVGDLPLKRSADAINNRPDIAQGVLSNIKRDHLHGGFSIQVTAPINEGNSGGPLFDAWGNVIGMNTWGPSKAEAEGVSYSLALGRVIQMLDRHGVSARPSRLAD